LVLITNKKSYMSLRLIPKSVNLNDLERRKCVMAVTLHYFTEFGKLVFRHIGLAVTGSMCGGI